MSNTHAVNPEMVKQRRLVRSAARLRQRKAALLRALPPMSPEDAALLAATPRPPTRGECIEGLRPCPWYGCRHHLGLHVTGSDVVVLIDPDDTTSPRCTLDVVVGEQRRKNEAIAPLLHMTVRGVQKVEARAHEHVREELRKALGGAP